MSSGKVSATGYIIAAALTKLARLPQWKPFFSSDMLLLNDAFARHAGDSATKSLIALLPPKAALFLMDKLFVPGLVQHYLLRKRFIEEQVTAAARGGVRQVINLGAGFDTLALRLAKAMPQVRFFEADLPQTQQAKLATLEAIHYPVPANCRFIPADLSTTQLKTALASDPQFDSALPTCIIIEGVLMYLFEPEVRTLFADMHALFTSSLTVAYGATISTNRRAGWTVKVINTLLSRGNEGTKWFCPNSEMPQFAAQMGYKLVTGITYRQLQRTYRSEADIAKITYGDEDYYIIEKII